ncbi:probable LRR receptor-like serine/threonine-protein kinase At3g47570 [Salvia miltiorrhiza]|uniref:probable LRR receptor-like serine/threonine-protein kinase At3g47570 n=1 Tax=Salvia miltiorrhiza TaxID=226208 RepID=UPI0025AC68FF|nr:probable LRR receptor-like serine/threonine-protein kinase At3g47570 [Salvia miltiorrhiza]
MAKPSISIPLILVLLLLMTTIPPSHSTNHTDLEALLAFKKSIRNDPLSSWNETTHFCRWNGVACSRKHPDRVISLSLRSQGLEGSLSPHIGNLSFLRNIDLQNNRLFGPIPQEIGRLRRLQSLELGNNSFTGGIPTNLSHCRDLYLLDLIRNQLTGPIVPEIGSLLRLQQLVLSRNLFSGTVPPFIGNLTNLFQLSLTYCGLVGEIPESLVRLRRMRYLYLFANNLTGSIPRGLYNLSSMEEFAFGSNQLHGTIPSDIVFTLPKLRFLDLGFNRFTGELPASLSNSSLIESIGVSSNNFTGNMIDLANLSTLRNLMATSNHFKGDIHTILSSLANCTDLTVVTLSDNLFTGSLPDSIGNLSNHLSFLSFHQNQISGSIPSSIGSLVGLSTLSASLNDLQGPIPSSIGNLDKLQEIYLGANRLTDEMPSSFGNLTLLNHLRLGFNSLFGSIPQSLGNCNNLLSLDLSYNNLNGSIPLEIMRLSSISIFIDLSHNALIGAIPPEVGALRNVVDLGFSYNRLSGTIPTSLISCVMLNRLRLEGNSLQGEIPDSLRALRGLEYLDLSQNNLSGMIPRSLVELRLLYLNLSFNALQGEVPTLGVFQNESAISLEGNHDLCGGIATLNLPSCPSSSANSMKKDLGKILIPTIVGSVCLALAVCFCVIMYRRRALQNVGALEGAIAGFLRLSYADLLNATGGFSEANLVGAGRFGCVYKGSIINDDDEHTDLAVKVLNLNARGASKSLASECNALRGIRHRNLVKIVSVCDSTDFQGNDFKALVYEFMPNGSLESWLHHDSEEQGRTLSTIQRLNIAIDIASAAEYLHCGTDSTVIHGDLKPSNILLDQEMVAHVGDFGLAKIISSISHNLSSSTEGSSTSTAIKGTIGYFNSRRPTTTDAFEGYLNLHDFVSNALPNRVMEVVDPFLHQQLNQGEKYRTCIVSILSIGVSCSKELPRDRMTMAEVVNELKKIRNVFLADRRGRNVAPYQH